MRQDLPKRVAWAFVTGLAMMGATGIGLLPVVAQTQDQGQAARFKPAGGNRSEQPEDTAPPPKPGCVRLFGKEVCGTPEAEVAANLITNGPSVSLGGSDSSHNVQGFVREGWPVVADFQPV